METVIITALNCCEKEIIKQELTHMFQILNAAQCIVNIFEYLLAALSLCLLAGSFLGDPLPGVGPCSLGALQSHSGKSRFSGFLPRVRPRADASTATYQLCVLGQDLSSR